MDTSSLSVPKVAAARGWFVAFWITLWGLMAGAALFFLGAIFMWPWGAGPRGVNWPLVFLIILAVVGVIGAYGRVIHSGLRADARWAKAVIIPGIVVVSIVLFYLLLFGVGMVNRYLLQ